MRFEQRQKRSFMFHADGPPFLEKSSDDGI